MPELPEVETVVRGLSQRLPGWVVEGVFLNRGDVVHGSAVPLCAALRARRVREVTRAGKLIRIQLSRGTIVFVHLGMTGRLVLLDRDEPLVPHTHLRITFRRRRSELRYCDPRRFGGIWLVHGTRGDGFGWLGRRLPPVGLDPLSMSAGEFRKLLAGRRRQIKSLLLDQRPISGVGNIYCDEALHRAAIHPQTRASDLDPRSVARLWKALRGVLSEAIRAGGSSVSDYRTADNQRGTFQKRHRVYGRDGQPCKECGQLIQYTTVAGRGTYTCPRCQRPILSGIKPGRNRRD